MKKRILTLILIIGLTIGIYPASVIHGEDSIVGIDRVYFTMNVPVAGQSSTQISARNSAIIDAGSHCSITDGAWFDQNPTLESASGNVTEFTGTFEAGKTYYAAIKVEPKAGYMLIQGDGASLNPTGFSVNGATPLYDYLFVINQMDPIAGATQYGIAYISFEPATNRLPDPTDMEWEGDVYNTASWKWGNDDLEQFRYGYYTQAKWQKGDETATSTGGPSEDTGYRPRRNYDEFFKQHGEGLYSFCVKVIAKENSGYDDSNLVWSEPVQHYAIEASIVTLKKDGTPDTENTGGCFLLVEDGGDHEQRFIEDEVFIYPAGSELEFRAEPETSYLLDRIEVGDTTITESNFDVSFDESKKITFYFKYDDSKTEVSLDFGEKHSDLAESVYQDIASDGYSVELNGAVLSLLWPTASSTEFNVTYYLSSKIEDELDQEGIDNGEMIHFADDSSIVTGKSPAKSYASNEDMVDEINETKSTNLDTSLTLYVWWDTILESVEFNVDNKICGAIIKTKKDPVIDEGDLVDCGEQDNSPLFSSDENSKVSVIDSYSRWINNETEQLYYPQYLNSSILWFNSDTPVKAGDDLLAAAFMTVLPGYAISSSTVVKVNGVAAITGYGYFGNFLVAGVEVEHDYVFDSFTWTGNETEGYTSAVANYKCRNNNETQAYTRGASLSDPVVVDPTATANGKTTYTATISAQNALDNQQRSEDKDAKETVLVSFVLDDQEIDQQIVDKNAKVEEPDVQIPALYNLDGWYENDSYNTKWEFDSDTVSEYTVLYARTVKKNTVIYYLNDGVAVSNPPQYELIFGESLLTYSQLGFNRDGYTFSGKWNTMPDGSGIEIADGGEVSEEQVEDILDANNRTLPLYAQYDEEKWITLDLNGGEWEGASGIVKVRQKEGSVFTLPKATRAGHTLLYWEGSKYYAGDEYEVDENHTFKAVWQKNQDSGSSYRLPKTGVE